MAGAGTLMGSPDTVLAMLLLVLLHSTALVTATTTQAFTTTGPGYSECHDYTDDCSHFVRILFYRVAGLSCPEAGVCLSAILRGFPDVFSLFGPCKVGEISFRSS